MSTKWVRAYVPYLCCDQLWPRSTPKFEVRLPRVERVLSRCPRCAWEPVPEDLPALVERPPMTALKPFAMTRFAAGMLPLDFKLAQAGDREPGSDDE